MNARLRAWIEDLGNQFWLRPALVVALCIALSQLAVLYDDRTAASSDPSSSAFGYSGGGEGARSLLGAVASSSIGVAGTIFSITIAALSLASGQMGRGCSATSCATAAIRSRSASSSAPSPTP